MSNYGVSVIVPIYNAGEYLAECLESLACQKLSSNEYEVIMVDDGSTDNCCEICRYYAGTRDNFHYYYKDNGGANTARLFGIEHANNDYIMFVDSDDIVKDTYLYNYVCVLKQYQPDFIVGSAIELASDRQYKLKINAGLYVKDDYSYFLENSFFRGYEKDWAFLPALWAKLFKKNLIYEYARKVPKKIYYGEDLGIWLPYLMECNSAYVLDDYSYIYRIHEGSVSRSVEQSIFENNSILYEYLRSSFLGQEELVQKKLMQQLEEYFYLLTDYACKNLYGFSRSIVKALALEQDVSVAKRTIWTIDYSLLKSPSRIILYGAGKVGQCVYEQMSIMEGFEIVCWTDGNADFSKKKDIIPVADALKMVFDVILVCVSSVDMASEICIELEEKGVNKDKVVWIKPTQELKYYSYQER